VLIRPYTALLSVVLATTAVGWTLAAGASSDDRGDLRAEVAAVFSAHRSSVPRWDRGLAKLAIELAAVDPATDVRAFLRTRGVAEGLVVPVAASGVRESEDVRGKLLSYVARSVMPQQVTHFGVAEQGSRALLVFVRRTLERVAWPAAARANGYGRFEARISAPGYRGLSLAVGRPDGRVDRVKLSRRGRKVSARVPFRGGEGRYMVEVIGRGPRGLEVLALREIHVGVPPLPTIPVARPACDSEPVVLEQRLLQRINRERKRLGLGELVLDAALTRTARAHARAMSEAGVTAHKLPGGSTARSRLRRAGIHTRRFYENVAMATTVEQAHRELWDSPSHRLALIDPLVTRVGVGVVRRSSEGGKALFIVQHLAAAR